MYRATFMFSLHHNRQMTVASVLLLLLTAFAVDPPDHRCRTQSTRNRQSRIVRLDDSESHTRWHNHGSDNSGHENRDALHRDRRSSFCSPSGVCGRADRTRARGRKAIFASNRRYPQPSSSFHKPRLIRSHLAIECTGFVCLEGVFMQRLLDGVSRFQREIFPRRKILFERLAEQQHPEALFITCADSRVVPDLITQSEPGDLFICRNAGNMVPPYGEAHGGVSATIEYAVCVLDIQHIIVCGHTDCGAMKGILHPEMLAEMPTVKSWLSHGELARRVVKENYPNIFEDEKLRVLTDENVVAQLDHLELIRRWRRESRAASCNSTGGCTTSGRAMFGHGTLSSAAMSRLANGGALHRRLAAR